MYKHGIQIRLTKTFRTKVEAKYWEREIEYSKGNGIPMAHWTIPFAEFYSNWLYSVKREDVRETTFQNYERSIRIIQRIFNNIRLRHLDDIIVQRQINEYAETRSKRTKNDLLTKINSALKYAYARDYTSIIKARGVDVT